MFYCILSGTDAEVTACQAHADKLGSGWNCLVSEADDDECEFCPKSNK
jgi:hypothetical protein